MTRSVKEVKLEIDANGTKHYTLNGLYHREDGPTIQSKDSLQYWYRDGKIHRDNGPAIIRPDRTVFWVIENDVLIFNDYCKKLKLTEQQKLALALTYNL